MIPKFSPLLLALALPWLPACSKNLDGSDTPLAGEVKRREPTRVRTIPLQRREMVRTLTTTTNIESEKEIELFPRTAGIVMAINVEEGERVTAGQVLAELDDRDARVAVADAEFMLTEAEANLPNLELAKDEAAEAVERARLTFAQAQRDVERNEKAGLISRNDLEQKILARDQAERDEASARIALKRSADNLKNGSTAIDRARLGLQRENLNLTNMSITAPFAGVIAQRSIKVGDSVSSAANAFILTDVDNLRAVFHRPQRELPLFKSALETVSNGVSEGARVDPIEIKVTSEALPGAEFIGRVKFVSPTIDATSGNFRITIALDQPDAASWQRLLPGMLVRLAVVTDRHPDAQVVPKRALQREGETSFLFLEREGTAHKVQVSEGFSDDEYVEVFAKKEGELTLGDAVVVIGNRDLEEGAEVLAEPWRETAEENGEAEATAARVDDER